MIERDPRVDPKPGDVWSGRYGYQVTVSKVGDTRYGKRVYFKIDWNDGKSSRGSEYLREWIGCNAEIVKREQDA